MLIRTIQKETTLYHNNKVQQRNLTCMRTMLTPSPPPPETQVCAIERINIVRNGVLMKPYNMPNLGAIVHFTIMIIILLLS